MRSQALLLGAVLSLAPTASADLLVEQWEGGGTGGLAGADARIASGPATVAELWAVIDFTDDPFGFAGEIPGSNPWPLATLLGQSGTGAAANSNFAARITGTIYISVADDYHFRTYNDDGVRLRVGGTTVISDNTYHPELPFNGSTLAGGATATPSFTAPFVSAGGADLEFEVTVDDGYGGTAPDTVVIHVQNRNDPPLASAAQPTVACLWPPNHQMVAVGITGVSDPDNNATITITGVTQDEPTNGLGDGDTAIDAVIDGGTVLLRAERSGKGDGRIYRISFTASDLEGSASGVVKVCVPHSPKKPAIDSLSIFDSTN